MYINEKKYTLQKTSFSSFRLHCWICDQIRKTLVTVCLLWFYRISLDSVIEALDSFILIIRDQKHNQKVIHSFIHALICSFKSNNSNYKLSTKVSSNLCVKHAHYMKPLQPDHFQRRARTFAHVCGQVPTVSYRTQWRSCLSDFSLAVTKQEQGS